MSSENVKRPRLSYSHLRSKLTDTDIIDSLRSVWPQCGSKTLSDLKGAGVKVIEYPFRVCVINDFINDETLLKKTINELSDVPFSMKNNDLYQFYQTDDLQNLTDYSYIPQLYDVFRNEVRSWVSEIFINDVIKPQIAATFSNYRFTDRLLCHDDKCEDRHIAFVIYLAEDWKEEDGGALQLFTKDENGYPDKIVESITPCFNSIVMFEVTNVSFHQVAEVLSKTKQRLSLNGWFHSEGKCLNKPDCKEIELKETKSTDNEYTLDEFFLYNYLDFNNQLDIKSMFENDSEIQLEEFLSSTFCSDVSSAFKDNGIKWNFIGPANVRNYEIADTSSLPTALQTLKDLLESKTWFKYLKTITGLDLAPSTSSDMDIWDRGKEPVCHLEFQKWTHGCYTLIHDKDPEFHSKALDVVIRFPMGSGKSSSVHKDEDVPESGHIIYVDKTSSKDDECLLNIGYKMNSLALIYRDLKSLRFTKYLDSTSEPFYQVFCTYRPWRPPSDAPDLRHCESDPETEPSFTSEPSDVEEEEIAEDEIEEEINHVED